MYTKKIHSGNAEVIDTDSVFAFVPDLLDEKNNVKDFSPKPIDVELFFQDELLFRLRFEFRIVDKESQNPGWESIPEKETKTQKFILKNIGRTKEPIGSASAFEVATAGDGSKFYVAFSAKDHIFGVKLDYTVFRVREVAE